MIVSDGHGDTRWSIEARRMLTASVALSLGLHVLLFVGGGSTPPRHGARSSAGSRPINVRLVHAPAAERPGPTTADGASLLSAIQATAPEPAAAAATASTSTSTPVETSAAVAPTSAAQGSSPATADAAASPFVAESGDEYVPRSSLTVPPVPRSSVILEMPPGMLKFGRRASVLSIFIDAQGQVDNIVVDGPPLPPSMEAAARQAFRAAKFSPGQVDGHAVKSHIRIEVVFGDDDPAGVARSPP